jgi:hypothetical protein
MSLPKMSMRIKDIEVRTCGDGLLMNGPHKQAEIIRWFKRDGSSDYCIVVAYWTKTKEGWDLKFVGNRPFEVEHGEFMRAAEFGQKFLEDQSEEEYSQ